MATDYSYDLEVSKDTKTATLTVNLPGRTFARDPILEFSDKSALKLLEEKGLGHLVITESPKARLSNWHDDRRNGVWTFGTKAKNTVTTTTETTAAATKTTTTEATVSDTEVKAATTRRTRKKTTKTTK